MKGNALVSFRIKLSEDLKFNDVTPNDCVSTDDAH